MPVGLAGCGEPACATATLLATLTRTLSSVHEPRLVRERLEEEVRNVLQASSIGFREHEPGSGEVAKAGNVVLMDVPGPPYHPRPRLEAVFGTDRQLDAHPVHSRTRILLRCSVRLPSTTRPEVAREWKHGAALRTVCAGRLARGSP